MFPKYSWKLFLWENCFKYFLANSEFFSETLPILIDPGFIYAIYLWLMWCPFCPWGSRLLLDNFSLKLSSRSLEKTLPPSVATAPRVMTRARKLHVLWTMELALGRRNRQEVAPGRCSVGTAGGPEHIPRARAPKAGALVREASHCPKTKGKMMWGDRWGRTVSIGNREKFFPNGWIWMKSYSPVQK